MLGTAPSVQSLARGEYYGNPQNLFWPFMSEIFGVSVALPYEERLRRLREHGVAIWDVAQRCSRVQSADATIGEVEPNDFGTLFRSYSGLRTVCFNGTKAEQLYRRHVDVEFRGSFIRMPSTSPANASIPRPEKLAAWRASCDFLLEDGSR